MRTQNIGQQTGQAAAAQKGASRATARGEQGGQSYLANNKTKEKTGAAVPRSKQMPEELKGNQVRARA